MIGYSKTMPTLRQQHILDIIESTPQCSISVLSQKMEYISIPTLNRDLALLVEEGFVEKHGKARNTYYTMSPSYSLLRPVSLASYFEKEPDTRKGNTGFNDTVLVTLQHISSFTKVELDELLQLQTRYQENIANYPTVLFQKEMERLTIELSWKSSQIEGNTYSLLDTERLFLEHEKALNKPESDATMLLNHKQALGYLLENSMLATQHDSCLY